MQVKSCFSRILDPYRAGMEIAEQLVAIQPEVIFLFSSIQYQGSPEILEAIYAELAPLKPILIGSTGDGIFAMEAVTEIGVSALALNSGGRVRWHLESRSGLQAKPYETTQACLNAVLDACEKAPQLLFLASDFRTDSTQVLKALNDGTKLPIVGGLAADDYAMHHCFVHANQEVVTDSIVLLAAEGELAFDIRLGNSPVPVGNPGVITEIDGTMLHKVDGIATMDFLEREIGKPLDHVDKGILTFQMIHAKHEDEHRIRSLLFPDNLQQERSVKMFGGVDSGEQIQICTYPADRMLADVVEVAHSLESLPFKPEAALVVSCAGRKVILGDDIRRETLEVLSRVSSIKALAGFPSFGEFAPIKRGSSYSQTEFHNMTFVLLLLGSSHS